MNHTLTLAPGDTLTVTAGPAGSTTTPLPGTGTGGGTGSGGTGAGTGSGGTAPAGTLEYELDWANPQRLEILLQQPDVLAIGFTTGNVSSTNNLPHVVVTNHNASPWDRDGVLAEAPGDFNNPLGPPMSGKTITATFGLGTGSGMGYYPVLKLNTKYWLNIRTKDGASGPCNVSVDLLKGAL